MAEQITLISPIITQKSVTTYKVARLILSVEDAHFILVVKNDLNEYIEASRQGTIAIDLMKILNKANNTIKSMEKRALEWLQTQPEGASLIGSITGTPD